MAGWRKTTSVLAVALCAIDLVAAALAHRHRHGAEMLTLGVVAEGHGHGLIGTARGRSHDLPWASNAPARAPEAAKDCAPIDGPGFTGNPAPGHPDDSDSDCSLCRHLSQPAAPLTWFAAPVPSGPVCVLVEHVASQLPLPPAARVRARGPPSAA